MMNSGGRDAALVVIVGTVAGSMCFVAFIIVVSLLGQFMGGC